MPNRPRACCCRWPTSELQNVECRSPNVEVVSSCHRGSQRSRRNFCSRGRLPRHSLRRRLVPGKAEVCRWFAIAVTPAVIRANRRLTNIQQQNHEVASTFRRSLPFNIGPSSTVNLRFNPSVPCASDSCVSTPTSWLFLVIANAQSMLTPDGTTRRAGRTTAAPDSSFR